MKNDEKKLVSVARHRNGVAGTGFHVILFRWQDGRTFREMVATVFPAWGSVAVLDVYETINGNIAFAEGNSWRGDDFEPWLRKVIAEADA